MLFAVKIFDANIDINFVVFVKILNGDLMV